MNECVVCVCGYVHVFFICSHCTGIVSYHLRCVFHSFYGSYHLLSVQFHTDLFKSFIWILVCQLLLISSFMCVVVLFCSCTLFVHTIFYIHLLIFPFALCVIIKLFTFFVCKFSEWNVFARFFVTVK